MKKALTSLFHIMLAVIVLVSGTAFTVKKMVCLSSGNVEIGFYTLEGCCGDGEEQPAGEQVSELCCQYSSETFHLDQNAFLKEFSLKKSDIVLFTAPSPASYVRPVITVSRNYIPYADLPPPLSGRERLTLNSIFII